MSEHKIILRAKEGPFRCGNCEYWIKEGYSCIQPNIVKLARKENPYNLKVNRINEAWPLRAADCCDYYEKRSEKPIDRFKDSFRGEV